MYTIHCFSSHDKQFVTGFRILVVRSHDSATDMVGGGQYGPPNTLVLVYDGKYTALAEGS